MGTTLLQLLEALGVGTSAPVDSGNEAFVSGPGRVLASRPGAEAKILLKSAVIGWLVDSVGCFYFVCLIIFEKHSKHVLSLLCFVGLTLFEKHNKHVLVLVFLVVFV